MSGPVDFREIVDRLNADVRRVAERYAPGGYEHDGKWWALNPGRDDRSIGSFWVNLRGPRAGRWCDMATDPKGGDMLDLIQLAVPCDRKAAVEEAMAFLGIIRETSEQRQRARQRAEEAKRKAAADHDRAPEDAARRAKWAHSIWLAASAELAGTPVDHYLRGRAIKLDELGHDPGAIRFHPKLAYEHVDRETGEVIEGDYPAMVTAMQTGDGAFAAVHRTYLERRAGQWRKARVPEPKKVLGRYKGAFIRLWNGQTGPRGGRLPLSKLPDGSQVWITEGIEDGLSVATLKRDAVVVSAVSLSNLGNVQLPPNISEVVICADNDPGRQAQEALNRAIAAHAKAGRVVRKWNNVYGGKDMNDLLVALRDSEAGAA